MTLSVVDVVAAAEGAVVSTRLAMFCRGAPTFAGRDVRHYSQAFAQRYFGGGDCPPPPRIGLTPPLCDI